LSEWLKVIVPSILVIVGWIIVHYLSQKRDLASAKRKAALEQCDAILEQAKKLSELAVAYHTSERDQVTEREIVAGFSLMGMSCSCLCELGIDESTQQSIASAHTDFKRAVTGQHFAGEHERPLSRDSAEVGALDVFYGELYRFVIRGKLSALKP
jgi:hypothetical protein